MISTLGELIAPLAEADFLTLLRKRELRFMPGAHADRLASFPNWSTVEQVIKTGALKPGDIKVGRESQTMPHSFYATLGKIDAGKLEGLLEKGVSIIWTNIERQVPQMAVLCDDLTARLREKIKVGMIASTGSGGAIKLHFDSEDIVIVQLESSKRWQIFGPAVADPVKGMPEQQAPSDAPIFDQVLKPGDMLFVPAGHWHHCENGPGRSLHLGVAVEPITAWHAVTSMAADLVAEEIFRRPLSRIETADDSAAHAIELKGRLAEKIAGLDLQQKPAGAPRTALHYVAFASRHDKPLMLSARLRVPDDGKDKHPAVILLHGSAGPSGREGGYADALNAAGFVTLEPDMWAAHNFKGGAVGRPMPADALADLYGARALLAAHPAVDAARIGAAGFSFGGVVCMLAATHRHNDKFLAGGSFAAFMPVYPATWGYNRVPGFEFGDLVDAPMLLITGALDQYDNDPEVSAKLVAGLKAQDAAKITTKIMPGSHHGFDMPGVDIEVTDPFGNQGKGGKVIMRYNPDTTRQSHRAAVEFFSAALK